MSPQPRLVCFYVGLFATAAMVVVPILFGRENQIEVARILAVAIWYGLFPIIVIGFLYLGFVASIDDRPAFNPVMVILSIIVCAALISVFFRSNLVLAMDLLNESPFKVVSVIERVSRTTRFGREVLQVSYKGDAITFVPRYGVFRPLKTTAPLEKGQKVLLVGRKSWAGIVVDEIKPFSGAQPAGAFLGNVGDVK